MRRALALVVAACTVGPSYHVPPAPVPRASSYKDGGTWRIATPSDALLRGTWWQLFREPELDGLEARLLIDNQTIAQAVASYAAARAQISAARAQYFPTVTVTPSASRSRAGSSYALPAEASWVPDLFGRVRNTVAQSRYNAQVSAADLENQRLLEQATLAQTYFALRGQDALQQLLDDTVKADAEIATVARSRFETGVDTEVAMVQAEQTLQTARVQATNAAILRAQFEDAIATLIGTPATTFRLPKRALAVTPPKIPVAAPSRLLERRPDIAAAERRMAAANAAIGIGYAAYYPDVTLSATIGFASSTIGSLLSWPSRVWSVGATLTELVFDGGQRRAVIDQAYAQYHGTVASYRQTVLSAFQQVEDQLATTDVLARELDEQRENVVLAERAFELERARYESGIDPYINLMQQQTILLAARQTLVSLEVLELQSAVTLIEAIGGGWDRSALPSP